MTCKNKKFVNIEYELSHVKKVIIQDLCGSGNNMEFLSNLLRTHNEKILLKNYWYFINYLFCCCFIIMVLSVTISCILFIRYTYFIKDSINLGNKIDLREISFKTFTIK